MPKRYADFKYGEGELYGPGTLAIRSSFLTAVVLDYGLVTVTVDAPNRAGQGYVLLRGDSGAAQDPSDGAVVSSGNFPAASFTVVDEDVPAGLAYYTLYVFSANGRWLKDAATSVVVAQDRGTWERLMYALPSVFTAADQNPLSDPDFDGDLARFLYSFALTHDELATLLDVVTPDRRRRTTIRRLHDSLAEGVGMPSEFTIGVRSTARLRRDAGRLYLSKGTLQGISAYVQALTGWESRALNSPNMVLSLDDASFEASTGAWTATGGSIARQVVNGSTVTAATVPYEDPIQPYAKAGVGRISLTSSTATATLPGSLTREASIPVVPSTTYYLTSYVRAISGTPSMQMSLVWLDPRGVVLSTATQSSTATTSAWATRSMSATSPAGSGFCRIQVVVTGSSGNAVDLDFVQLSSSDVSYQDPRLVTVICAPNRVNLLGDPGFDLTTVWSASTGAISRSTEKVHLGTYAGKAVGSPFAATSEEIPVVAGYSYALSGYAARGTSGTATMRIDWYGPSLISSSSQSFGTLGTDFARADLTATAPTGATTARIVLAGTGTAYLDSFAFERTDRPQIYFDSSTADSEGEDGRLTTVGAKRYHLLYSNRLTKLSRSITTLPFYLPQGVRGRVVLWDSTDPVVQAFVPYDQ